MKKSLSSLFIIGSVAIFITAIFIVVFNSLPIENTNFTIDWSGIYNGLIGGSLKYGTGIRNPPWSLLPILPLGLLTFRSSWGLLVLVTLIVEVVSVPGEIRKGLRIPLIILVTLSFPSLRNIADGNLEVLPIAGILMLLSAIRKKNPWLLALGLLLSSAKPQTTWILLAVTSFYLVYTWPRKHLVIAAGIILPIIIISMVLYGSDWIESMIAIKQRGSIMDICLLSALSRLALPPIIIWCFWGVILCITLYIAYSTRYDIDRKKAGLFISAGLLLAPYAAGNSLLTLLAVGVIVLYFEDTKSSVALSVLFYLPYLFITDYHFRYWYGAYYATIVLFVSWIVFAWQTRAITRTDPHPIPASAN